MQSIRCGSYLYAASVRVRFPQPVRGCRGSRGTLCNCFMKIEATSCVISGHPARTPGGYVELMLLLSEGRLPVCAVGPSRSPLTGFLTLVRLAPSLRPPGPAILARSGRPFPAGGCPTHVPTSWEKSTAVAVKIRLKRLAKIREPYYRVVVADSRTKRDGRAIEEIGKYHPKLEPSLIEISSERVQYWLSVGRHATER